jgi:hypothetical protein
MKRRGLSPFLLTKPDQIDFAAPEWKDNIVGASDGSMDLAKKVHSYIHTSTLHPGINLRMSLRLVIQVAGERTSFIKASRSASKETKSRVYATIDRNIISTRLSPKRLLNFDMAEEAVNLEGQKSVFPHAILQIRWEGDSPRWLEELDGSVLIERINGFSMYPHVVATLLSSQVSNLPY